MPATELRIGTRSQADRYVGVLRAGRKIVAQCGHLHHNRDMTTRTNGQSARDCITDILRAARDEHFAADLIEQTRTRSSRPRSGGFAVSTATLQRWKAADAEEAAQLSDLIAAVRALDVDSAPMRTPASDAPAAVEVGEIPDWMLGEAC